MISFGEINKFSEDIDVKKAGYSEIKSSKEPSPENAKNFWDKVFNNKADAEEDFENDFIEIFGRDESDFCFDINLENPELLKILDLFTEDKWQFFDKTERITAMETLVSVISELQGIKERPALTVFDGESGVRGAYNYKTKSLSINSLLLDSPKDVIGTISHEMRHAYQDMRAQMGETRMDYLYKLNFENYIEPLDLGGKYLFFTDYQDQLVEAEARAFSSIFKGAA